MSTEQHDADAYGQELTRISHHQHEATDARFTVFQALTAAGIGHEQADDIVAKLEAGAVAGAHTWISESSPPHGSEPRFEDGWHAGVRDVASYLLRIADTTATAQRGRAASSAMLLAHVQQPTSPAPEETTARPPTRCRRWRRRTSWRRRNASRGPWPHQASVTGRTVSSWTSL
ncbi:hypothetical protein [Streptomyces sp. NPDC019208]|uniref:hypothetical protein n=1 Tax=Streptomyces sp. NPDC019208 TaxID=3154683 RepID=UPI0033F37FD9